jgi:hypothetical protein
VTKKHCLVAYLRSLFHRVRFVIVNKFPLLFVLVQEIISFLPSMEEGEEQYDYPGNTVPFNPNYCKRFFFDFIGLKFLHF